MIHDGKPCPPPLCIYCGKPVDTNLPHWFGSHFEGQPMPHWHLECDPDGEKR